MLLVSSCAGQCFRYPSKHGRGTTGRGNLSGRKHSKLRHHVMLGITPCKCIETEAAQQFCHCSDQPVKTSRPVQDYIPSPISTSCELVYHKQDEPGSSSYGGIDQHCCENSMLWGVKIGQSALVGAWASSFFGCT